MRKTTLFIPILALLGALLFTFSTPALADDDPPGRVARLNYIQGSISFQPSGETDWVQANPNRPLTVGDNLWADRNSRGELHIGSTSVRLASETGITFLNLDDRTIQIQLAQGSMNVNVRRLEGGDAFEIDTPNLAFTLQRPGEYRVDVDPNGNATTVAVRAGEGEATGGGSEYHMDSGDQATFSGTDSLTFDNGQARRFDEFDAWCRGRDDREEHSQSARYVSRDVIGYEDLDEYGEWRNVPEYGNVWFPARVDAGWAPYRHGHWVWVAPWGWTWVEDEPWGFAPFHYGRWAEVSGSWCWVPGPVVVRPVYAPALVVFVGGPRFNMSLSVGGGGGVAWFPLGPREVYVPPYRTSERYVQNVNVTNTTVNVVNVTNVYNNVNVNNTTVNKVTYMHQNNVAAVTAVSHDTFVNARPVAASTVRVDARQIQTAEVQRTVAVAPVQKSVVGAAPVATVKPPAAVMQRQVVAKETPAPMRASFNNNGAPQQTRSFRQAGPPAQQSQQQMQPRQQQPAQPQQSAQPQIQQQQHPQLQQSVQQQTRQPQQQQQLTQPQQQQQQHPQLQQSVQPESRTPQSSQQQHQQIQQQQQQQTAQPQFRPGQPPQQQPQQQQIQQHPQQQQQIQQQQQSRPQMDQTRKPPEPQNPPVKFAPPARATEDTYHPHQFEKQQEAAPQRNAAPPKTEKEPPKAPERGQDSKKQDDKERK
jgi:DNA segregation ATPase FtsK/SpoIIIE-like protein